MPRQLITMSY